MGYEKFYPYYDQAMKDYSWCARLLHAILPEAGKAGSQDQDTDGENGHSSVLELGCGTGRILELVQDRFSELHGLDLSPGMLSVARTRHPSGHFYHMDMTSFSLHNRFDAILCLFDSINHIGNFKDWEQVFRRSAEHLMKDGLFILDINTPLRLQRLSILPAFITLIDGDGMVIMDIEEVESERFTFHVEVFEPASGKDMFCRHRMEIHEYTPDPYRVLHALKENFTSISVYNEELELVREAELETCLNGRMFFACRNRVAPAENSVP